MLTKKLSDLGFELPPPAAAVAAYLPYVVTGTMIFISGQLPVNKGKIQYTGLVGKDLNLADGQAAAQLCGLNILAQLNEACGGDIGQIDRCVKLGGFVASAPGFFDQPKVINGVSELMEKVFGEKGRHARFAVGVANLPLNAAVEVDAIFSLRD